MERYKAGNPDFYGAYQVARVIVDTDARASGNASKIKSLSYYGGGRRSFGVRTKNKKLKNTYFVAFGYGLTRNREFLKASQKPSRHSARLGAFSGKALRGA